MTAVRICYNPYTVETGIQLDGRDLDMRYSPLAYMSNKRLQEWIEARGTWKGIFQSLRDATGDSDICLEFHGTSGDFLDLVYAKEKYGHCFNSVNLVHLNQDKAAEADPYKKMQQLKRLYNELQNGPIEEFKTEEICRNFEAAINSEFRIIVVAPMSSGKSTLINAILGHDLLPSANQATTAVVTEICDNDSLEEFRVSAIDKQGNEVIKNAVATRKLIESLNFSKDERDPEMKTAKLHTILIEGNIPALPSQELQTVFVDTPGGNNAQNDEHREMMDKAIRDENKCLILYVFDGNNLTTNDGNTILQKIASAMRDSANGKQSRDRFLFVANKMDAWDPGRESYESGIQNSILPLLAKNGIEEPNLYLVSAQTARLIRICRNKEALTEDEADDLESLVRKFNRPNRDLTRFSSISAAKQKELSDAARKYAAHAKHADSEEEQTELRYRAAELNCGIPALEHGIREYLEKYAISIKIKTAHDSFMHKVKEQNMVYHFQAELANSEEAFERTLRDLAQKREQLSHDQRFQKLRDQVGSFTLDKSVINKAKAEVVESIRKISENRKETVEIASAESLIAQFQRECQQLTSEVVSRMDHEYRTKFRDACQEILNEYSKRIRELDNEGFFRIGNYDITQESAFSEFRMDRPEDIRDNTLYQKEVKIENGWHYEKEPGILNFFRRLIRKGGYKKVTDYITKDVFRMKDYIQDTLTEFQSNFDKGLDKINNDVEHDLENMKRVVRCKLSELDEYIWTAQNRISAMLEDKQQLEATVKKNQEKMRWVEGFIKEMRDLLEV